MATPNTRKIVISYGKKFFTALRATNSNISSSTGTMDGSTLYAACATVHVNTKKGRAIGESNGNKWMEDLERYKCDMQYHQWKKG